MMITKPKIHFLIERFFVIAGLIILIATLSTSVYFNKYDENEKQKNNLQKIHSMLSQLIVPSLIISDLSEVKRLLYMASAHEEAFMVVDNDGMLIMPDYSQHYFSEFILKSPQTIKNCKSTEIIYKYINGQKYLINCSVLKNKSLFSNATRIGILLSFTRYKWFTWSPFVFYFFGFLIMLFFILIILFRRMLYNELLKPLIILKDRILAISTQQDLSCLSIDAISNAPQELIEIKEAFERLLLSWQEEYSRRIEAQKMKALIDLAVGVAHDIRSPLIALDVIIKDINHISEEHRIVIRNSVNRINDIANNLLTQYKQKKNLSLEEMAVNINPELISDLLMSIVSEKRVQYKNCGVELSIHFEETTYGRFALVLASAFNRVFSNLIDNAAEALAKEILLSVSCSNSDEKTMLNIKLQDNGRGISQEVLTQILNGQGISSKEKGHGLGLLNSIRVIEKDWGGQIHIQSSVNVGTIIEIILPQTSPPS